MVARIGPFRMTFALVILTSFAVLIAACGSAATPTPTPRPQSTPTPTASGPGQTPDAATPAPAPVTDFYRGKTIRIIVGFTPGGGFDAYARAVARHLPKHIPGRPNVVVQNMPGGGGLTAANYIYNGARQDGTALLTTTASIYFSQFLRETGVNFDVREMPALGSPVSDNILLYMRDDYMQGRDVFEWASDVQSGALRPAFIGGTSIDATLPHRILAELVPGLEYDLVLGYPGNTEVRLAVRRGEVDGTSGSESSLLEQLADMVESGELVIAAQTGTAQLERDPNYDAPTLSELADSSFHQALVSAFVARSIVGRPFLFTPNVPDELTAVMRQAMWDTYNDPELLEEAARANRPMSPVSYDTMGRMYAEVLNTPEEEAQRIRELLSN
jgi:tripartite-type tricarboxylate transporter receptor subunit TctC